MKRLLTVALSVLLSAVTLSAQNANIKYSGDAQPGDKVYSCAFDGYVNMRETPSYQATKVGKFSNGSTGAELIQNLGEWMEIDNNGVRGFVPSRFVQDEPTVAYTGSATVNDITGMWRAGFFGPLSLYDNGYWSLFGNYFDVAYGYYILQNNEIKLIAIKKNSPDIFIDENGNPVYITVRKEYSIIDISILNNENRVDFLTGFESDEEMEGVDPALCTKAEFMQYGKKVKNMLHDIILTQESNKEEIIKLENEEEPAVEEVVVSESESESAEAVEVYEVAEGVESESSSKVDFGAILEIALSIVVAVLILVGIYFLTKKLVKVIKNSVAKVKANKEAIKEKISSTINNVSSVAKEQMDSVKSATVNGLNKLSEQAEGKKRGLSVLQWLLIVGGYIMLFWDVRLGFLTLVAVGIYALIRKFAPEKLEKMTAYCSEKIQPITSRPMLAKGLCGLVAGYLIFRIFFPLTGLIIFLLSIVFLVCTKFAPAVCEKVVVVLEEAFAKLKPLFGKVWVKVACVVLLIAFPLSMSQEQTSALSLTPVGAEIQEYHYEKKIERLEDNDEPLTPREMLKKRASELRMRRIKAESKLMGMNFSEHQAAQRELERIKYEERMLEEEAQAMGIPSLMLL